MLIAENVLVLRESLVFYLPTQAIVTTVIAFILLFVLISFFVSFVLRKDPLVDLIKGDKGTFETGT